MLILKKEEVMVFYKRGDCCRFLEEPPRFTTTQGPKGKVRKVAIKGWLSHFSLSQYPQKTEMNIKLAAMGYTL